MINLRTVYRKAEEHTTIAIVGLFVLLALLILLQTFTSPTITISVVVSIIILAVAIIRPLWVLGFVAIYLPLESLVLKFIPNDAYVFVRYASEGLIYLLALFVFVKIITRTKKWKPSELDLPFILFGVMLLASVIINLVSPTVAVLGVRQIIRFPILFFLILQLQPSKEYIKRLTYILFGIVLIECIIGLLQTWIGERMDLFLLPSETRSLGEITLASGVTEFWDPGSRIFATLGRYDRLGNFLYIFLLLGTGFIFVIKDKILKNKIFILMAIGLPALILTYSRASWFVFALGFLFIGLWIKRDRRVLIGLITLIIVVFGYLAYSGIAVRNLSEASDQTFAERFYESFSLTRWKGEYYGLGRVYWFVQTPATVVLSSPFFGVGPGQFGGGAVAALHNTKVYDYLGLPFGVFGTEGSIDNNWFALWGEVGTIGVAIYIWMMFIIFVFAIKTYRNSKDPFVRSLSLGLAACVLAVCFNAFTSTVFEIRTTAFYLWMYAGFVFVLGEKREVKKLSR